MNIDLSESLSDRTDDLGRSVEQLRLLSEAVSHLGEGVLITSDDLEWPGPNIVFVNEAISRMTGYDADELIGQSPRMLQGAATDPEVVQGIKSKLVETGSCIVELVNYRKDGTPYEVELFITSLFNACGKRTHFVSIQRDITDRKALVEALRREHELNSSIVNTSKSVTLVLDAECRILQFNPYLENLTGWRFDEVQGKDWFEMFLPGS